MDPTIRLGPNCRFIEESHTYYMDDVPVPSVTQALVDAGIINTEFFTAWGRMRGSAVHKATELYDQDDLNEETLDPAISGYLEAWKRFRREFRLEIEEIELEMYHPGSKYAGTLDRAGVGHNGKDRVIVDIKTGVLTRAVGLQLTGYADLYQEMTGKIVNKIYGVQLKEDGSYRMRMDPLDFATWRGVLAVSQWKNER